MKIAEVSQQSGISADTLRYYERIGLIPPVNRTDSGIREYDEVDIRRIEFVKCMRRAGLPIEVLIEYFHLVEQGDQTVEARKEILINQRTQLLEKLDEIQSTLDVLEHKIEIYENVMVEKEQRLANAEIQPG